MVNKVLCSAMVLAAGALVATPADASFILRLTDSGTGISRTVVDNGAGDLAAGSNLVLFMGTVGNFAVAFQSNYTDAPGSDLGATIQSSATAIQHVVSSTNPLGTAGTLRIEVTSTDFNAPGVEGSELLLSNATSASAARVEGASLTSQAFGGTNNGAFEHGAGTGVSVCSGLSPGSTVDCSVAGPAATTSFFRGALFSLTGDTSLTLLAGGGLLNYTESVNAQAVPEPGSMVLLGTGLLGLARAARRRRQARLQAAA